MTERASRTQPLTSSIALALQQPDGQHRTVLSRSRVLRWVRAALDGTPAQVTVRVVSSAEALALNRDYRSKAYPTNVLTFDYAREPMVMADIVLCADVVQAEAHAAGCSLHDHYAHLVVHGVLHALGMDHERHAQAVVMEAREVAVLARLGVSNPYAR
jgi:probable rRNA maturation factor